MSAVITSFKRQFRHYKFGWNIQNYSIAPHCIPMALQKQCKHLVHGLTCHSWYLCGYKAESHLQDPNIVQTWESLPLKYITLKVLLCVMKETCNPCQSTQKLCYALQVIKGRLLNFSTWDLFTLCIWVYIINGSKIFAVWPILKENAVIGTFSSRQ